MSFSMSKGFKLSRRKKRLLLALVALLLAVFGAEAALRVAGRWLYRPIEAEVTAFRKSGVNEFVILCLGDSHTYGVDAPRNLSYPRQLANLLNNADPNTKYRVINYGVPGFNSSQALRRLRKLYAAGETRPRVVIINVGKNNDHNFQEARFWLDKQMKTQPLRAQLEYLLQHAKVYRLGEIAIRNFREKLTSASEQSNKFLLDDVPLLTDWLRQDYRAMIELILAHDGRVVLLNYFMPFEYVDQAMSSMAAAYDVPRVEIVWFRLPMIAIRPLVGPTAHPNEHGYAAIARFVFEELKQNDLLPESFPASNRR